jgi:hypothetical protein
MQSFGHLTLQISDVMSISAPDTFTRPVYAGNAISTVRSKDDIKLFTVRASTWEPAQEGDKEAPVDVKEAENVGPGTFASGPWCCAHAWSEKKTMSTQCADLSSTFRTDTQSNRSGSRKRLSNPSGPTSLPRQSSSRAAAASNPRTRSTRPSSPSRDPSPPRAMRTTRSRSGRPVKSSRQSCTSRWGFRARFSTWRE